MTSKADAALSRRAFLRQMGAGAAALIAAQLLAAQQAHAEEPPPETEQPQWGILIDLTRCVGCETCALACKAANNLPNPTQPPDGLSSRAFTFVDTHIVPGDSGEIEARSAKRQCMHCLNPACVSACPAAAMYRREDGLVLYRAERCLGCRYCQMACPFGVPAFEWDDGVTPTISKCWLCVSRLDNGQQPACAEACPTGAIRFGRREALLAQARAQIESNPGRYIDHIFGEHEVGGTSVLYLSDIPFEQLGFPANLPDTAPPEETEKIMRKLPAVITGTAALMVGAALYTHRQ
ncbi:MAG: 4Fe-4S dicluster domain-containing protein [Anaerolineae bacterium]